MAGAFLSTGRKGGCGGVREWAVSCGHARRARPRHAGAVGAGVGPWRAPGRSEGGLRFAFYGRVSTEDRQDPVTSLARQRAQAEALVRGHGRVVAEFLDTGQSRTVAWARRP